MWRWCTPFLCRLGVAGAVVAIVGMMPAAAGVRTSSATHDYRVPGTTAKSVVTFMLRNPFAGDHGGAFANIRPKYKLSIVTRQGGGVCRVRDVDVDIHFVVTLPKASDFERMSAKTRSAWRSFVAFARRHEEAHQTSYVGCAKRFAAAARRRLRRRATPSKARSAGCSSRRSGIARPSSLPLIGGRQGLSSD